MVIEFCPRLFPPDAKPVWQTESSIVLWNVVFSKKLSIFENIGKFVFYFAKENFKTVFFTLKKIHEIKTKIMKLSLITIYIIINRDKKELLFPV